MVKLTESHPNSWHRLSPIEYWMKMQRLWLTRTKKSVPHNIGSHKHLKETLNITQVTNIHDVVIYVSFLS